MVRAKTVYRQTNKLPPGGGACWWCNAHLYRRRGLWSYAVIHEDGYDRAVHLRQCAGSDYKFRCELDLRCAT